MSYYPVCLDLRDRDCLVIGTSKLADEKVQNLLDSGARVIRSTAFREEEAERVFLIVADIEEAEAVSLSDFCWRKRIFLNVVDKPRYCSFILPAVVRRQDLLIAVSTSGCSPSLAGKIRAELEQAYGSEFGTLTEFLGASRSKVKALLPSYSARRSFYSELLDEQLPKLRLTGTADAVAEALWTRLKEVELGKHE